jgi:hypothetical protein
LGYIVLVNHICCCFLHTRRGFIAISKCSRRRFDELVQDAGRFVC